MAIFDAFKRWMGWIDKGRKYQIIDTTTGSGSFTSFGNNPLASDLVKTGIHRICEEVSKCRIQSVIVRNNPKTITIQNDSINACFNGRVNPYMGMRDFLYKIAWQTIINSNCYVYWAYDEVPIGNGYVNRITRGFYILDDADVRIYIENGEPRIEINARKNGEVFDMPYSEIIHIRRNLSENVLLGGGEDGKTDWRGAIKNLQTITTVKEYIPKSLKASLGMKGLLSMRTVADINKKEVTREEFEKHLTSSESGIIATDYEADFTPINIATSQIPDNVLELVINEVLAPLGVSMPIYLGNYTDDEYTAFYQTAVEGLLIEIAEAFKLTLFTPRQLAYGETIKFYDRLVQSLSFSRRQEICAMTKEDGLLTRDERRELLGYEPDGKETLVSLNYIRESIASQYQMQDIAQQTHKEEEDNNE